MFTLSRDRTRTATMEDASLIEGLNRRSSAVTAALESVPGNCFIADLGLTLVWMNRTAVTTMDRLAPALQSAFGIRLSEVLGGSIHRFHKNPRAIERLLDEPGGLPRQAVFSFGAVTLSTNIDAIVDAAGTKLGYIVLWENISSQVEDYAQFDRAMATLSDVSDAIVHAAESSTGNADAVADAAGTLRGSVEEIARSSTQISAEVQDAVSAVEQGMATLRELAVTSNEIGEFLGLITSVSEQTKLLALNATIEAARAGEAGKGFAVVADEVKSLAGTTANSIADIESRIAAIQASADKSVQALRSIDELVGRISQSQSVMGSTIDQQLDMAGSIAQSAGEIARDVADTSQQAARITEAVRHVSDRTQALRGR
ncbi:MAG: methyl-accepting chemotaxis protein [Kineosporiaceae bacterium]